MKDIEVASHYDQMNSVMEETLKGTPVKDIAAKLNMSRAVVLDFQEEWKALVRNDSNIHARAREALEAANQHFNMIIQEAWDAASDAKVNNQGAVRVQALKLARDTEAGRVDMLNKAGLLENNELAQRVLEAEKNHKIILGILRELPPDIQAKIASRISEITNKAEAIAIE